MPEKKARIPGGTGTSRPKLSIEIADDEEVKKLCKIVKENASEMYDNFLANQIAKNPKILKKPVFREQVLTIIRNDWTNMEQPVVDAGWQDINADGKGKGNGARFIRKAAGVVGKKAVKEGTKIGKSKIGDQIKKRSKKEPVMDYAEEESIEEPRRGRGREREDPDLGIKRSERLTDRIKGRDRSRQGLTRRDSSTEDLDSEEESNSRRSSSERRKESEKRPSRSGKGEASRTEQAKRAVKTAKTVASFVKQSRDEAKARPNRQGSSSSSSQALSIIKKTSKKVRSSNEEPAKPSKLSSQRSSEGESRRGASGEPRSQAKSKPEKPRKGSSKR